jgi:proteasome lid subunit RPN8/RPN11
MNSSYRFALEMFDQRGAPLAQEPVAVDLLPAEEWARFMALRTGVPEAAGASAHASLQPIWHLQRGRPYTEGFSIRLETSDHHEAASSFTALYFGEQAQVISSRLVERNLLQPGDGYRFIVAAYPGSEEPDPAPDRFRTEEVSPDLPLRDGDLRARLRDTRPEGELVDGDYPVFIPRHLLDETAALARAAGSVEIGGILVGHLYRDAGSGEVFADVTAQIHAAHAQGDRSSLKFTPESWTQVRGVIDLRARDELMLGWYHSHPVHAWCAGCPVESRRRCALSNRFFSAHDRSLHRTVFSRAWGLALVVNDIGDGGPTHSLFGWRHGLVQSRGFHLSPTQQSAENEE